MISYEPVRQTRLWPSSRKLTLLDLIISYARLNWTAKRDLSPFGLFYVYRINQMNSILFNHRDCPASNNAKWTLKLVEIEIPRKNYQVRIGECCRVLWKDLGEILFRPQIHCIPQTKRLIDIFFYFADIFGFAYFEPPDQRDPVNQLEHSIATDVKLVTIPC